MKNRVQVRESARKGMAKLLRTVVPNAYEMMGRVRNRQNLRQVF